MKALMVCCNLNEPGGVASYLKMLRGHIGSEISFFSSGHGHTLVGKVFCTFLNYFRFFVALCLHRYDVVALNPSLQKNAIMRDSGYAFIAKRIFRKKLVVFWHGWNSQCQQYVEEKKMNLMRNTFFQSDRMFVLASKFGDILTRWGYSQRPELFTTCYNEAEIPVSERSVDAKRGVTLLFLARMEAEKGIFTALEAFQILQQKLDIPVSMIVAGSGPALDDAKQFVQEKNLSNVTFTGFVSGEAKQKAFRDSDIFFFPSAYGEGMPCALLEAMGSGQPVVVSAVGGIPDFFCNGEMGYMLDSNNPAEYADVLQTMIEHPNMVRAMSSFNAQYAAEHFTSAHVAAQVRESLKETAHV